MIHSSFLHTQGVESLSLGSVCERVASRESVGAGVERVGGVGVVVRGRRGVGGGGAVARAAGEVLPVRVLVEPPLGHEQRGDGPRRQARRRRARRDAAAPALAARVVQHVQARHRPPNAVCTPTHHTCTGREPGQTQKFHRSSS